MHVRVVVRSRVRSGLGPRSTAPPGVAHPLVVLRQFVVAPCHPYLGCWHDPERFPGAGEDLTAQGGQAAPWRGGGVVPATFGIGFGFGFGLGLGSRGMGSTPLHRAAVAVPAPGFPPSSGAAPLHTFVGLIPSSALGFGVGGSRRVTPQFSDRRLEKSRHRLRGRLRHGGCSILAKLRPVTRLSWQRGFRALRSPALRIRIAIPTDYCEATVMQSRRSGNINVDSTLSMETKLRWDSLPDEL